MKKNIINNIYYKRAILAYFFILLALVFVYKAHAFTPVVAGDPAITDVTTSSVRLHWIPGPEIQYNLLVKLPSENTWMEYGPILKSKVHSDEKGLWVSSAEFRAGDKLSPFLALTPNTKYQFMLRSSDGTDSDFTIFGSATTLSMIQVPAKPINFEVTTSTSNSISVGWQQGVGGNEDVFLVDLLNSSSESQYLSGVSVLESKVLNLNQKSFTFINLSPTATYYVGLRSALLGDATSSATIISAAVSLPPPPPEPDKVAVSPTNFRIDKVTTSSVAGSWTKGVGGDENMFIVELLNSDNSSILSSKNQNLSETTFIFNNLLPNNKYNFRLSSAVNGVTTSSPLTVSTTTLALPIVLTPQDEDVIATPVSVATPTNFSIDFVSTSSVSGKWVKGEGGDEDAFIIELLNFDKTTVINSKKLNLSETNFSFDNISPNTLYNLRLSSVLSGIATSTAVELATTTLSNIPKSLNYTSEKTSLNLTWIGDSTEYFLKNITNNTYADWLVGNNKIFTGLSCGTNFTISIKGRNSAGVETQAIQKEMATKSCPTETTNETKSSKQNTNTSSGTSGSSNTAIVTSNTSSTTSTANPNSTSTSSSKVDNSILIASGLETNSKIININLAYSDAKKIILSEDINFSGASWKEFRNKEQFTLTDGAGDKNIYFKFYLANTKESNLYKIKVKLKENYTPAAATSTASSTEPKLGSIEPVKISNLVIDATNLQLKPNNLLKYTYQYRNETDKPSRVRVVRQVVDSNNKVVAQGGGFRSINKGSDFKYSVSELLPRKLSDGVYKVLIKVNDFYSNKLIVQNSFDFQIKK